MIPIHHKQTEQPHTEQKNKPRKTYTRSTCNNGMITQYNLKYSETFTKMSIIAEQQVPSTQHLIHLMVAS
jgi:hypothetical protein